MKNKISHTKKKKFLFFRDTGKCTTLDAREVAPLSTHAETFVQNPKNAFYGRRVKKERISLHVTRFANLVSVKWNSFLVPLI